VFYLKPVIPLRAAFFVTIQTLQRVRLARFLLSRLERQFCDCPVARSARPVAAVFLFWLESALASLFVSKCHVIFLIFISIFSTCGELVETTYAFYDMRLRLILQARANTRLFFGDMR